MIPCTVKMLLGHSGVLHDRVDHGHFTRKGYRDCLCQNGSALSFFLEATLDSMVLE